jgi:hypothetical protein
MKLWPFTRHPRPECAECAREAAEEKLRATMAALAAKIDEELAEIKRGRS